MSEGPAAPRRAKLPAPVYWFGATSLANDAASEMSYPLLPAFITSLGGGAFTLGLLDGLADAVAAIFKLVSGYLAERPRLRGPLVIAGYGLAAAVRPLIAAASAGWHVVSLRSLDRVGKGLRTAPRDVIIADVVDDVVRGRAFAVHRAADHTGAVLGPVIASALIAAGLSVRGVFWAAALPGTVAVLLAWMAVRKSLQVPVTAAEPARDRQPATRDQPPAASHQLPAFLWILGLAALLRVPETLLILRAQDLGVAVAAVPLLWAGLHVVRSLASYPGGVLADRWGPLPTLAVGWLVYALLAALLALADSAPVAVCVFLAFGLFTALTESPERKLVARLAAGARRGRGFGQYHASVSIAALPGAAFLGWLYQAHGAAAALMVSAGGTMVALLLLGVGRLSLSSNR